MLISPEQLPGHLQRQALASVYVVSGDEPLLCQEASDQIRRAARASGCDEREVFHADARTDWQALRGGASLTSLFSSRRLIEVRLPGGKPGKDGAAALAALAADPIPDSLLLVNLPELDWSAKKAEWVVSMKSNAVWVDVTAVRRDQLPQWIAARLATQEQRAGADVIEFLVERFEGNLLAAAQEITKLGLLCPPGKLEFDAVRQAVYDVARYDLGDLPRAMLEGDGARIHRLVAGLRAEGEPLPLILWILAEELRGLIRLKQTAGTQGRLAPGATRGMRFNSPVPVIERALPRLDIPHLASLLDRCARLDRLSKGLRVPGMDEDPWVELAALAVDALPAQPARH